MSMPPPPPETGPSYGGYGGVAQPHPRGTLVLVLGILGVLCCGVAGIVAIVMGKQALDEIDANPSAYNNRGMVQAGFVLGIIGVVLWAIGIVVRIAAG